MMFLIIIISAIGQFELISNTDNKKYNVTVFDLVLENIAPDTEEFKNRIN